ncbi:MAG: triose-phosphate isomerase [bacterium]
MNNKPIIIANWKCNPTNTKDAEYLFNTIRDELRGIKNVKVVICPPFIYLPRLMGFIPIQKKNKSNGIAFGAQDCFWEEKGAYTGEISPLELKNLGCEYVIVGHSERRNYLKETDSMINKKINSALRSRLKPILCVGEEARDDFNSEGRLSNEMSLIVGEQIEKCLSGISAGRIRDIVIAYEPIWAIGSGNVCSPDDTMKAALFIRKILSKLYNRSIAEKAEIIYGGSVVSGNAIEYIKDARMDGLLIGGASLNATEFVKIVKKVVEIGV